MSGTITRIDTVPGIASPFTREVVPAHGAGEPPVPVPEPVAVVNAQPDVERTAVSIGQSLQASLDYDEQLKMVIITLRRSETNEVVQQIPSEKIQHMLAQLLQTMEQAFDAKG